MICPSSAAMVSSSLILAMMSSATPKLPPFPGFSAMTPDTSIIRIFSEAVPCTVFSCRGRGCGNSEMEMHPAVMSATADRDSRPLRQVDMSCYAFPFAMRSVNR